MRVHVAVNQVMDFSTPVNRFEPWCIAICVVPGIHQAKMVRDRGVVAISRFVFAFILLLIASPSKSQFVERDTALYKNRLIGIVPYLSGGGTFGYCQEWYRLNSHRSIAVSLDYITRNNYVNGVPQKYYSFNVRPGVRYYYSLKNNWFYHTLALLAVYEDDPMPWKNAWSLGAGVSVLGFRVVLKDKIILELEGFVAYGLAYISPYNDEPFYEGRFFSLENFRIGFRF